MKATDKFKLFLNKLISDIDPKIHNELWDHLIEVIKDQEKDCSVEETIYTQSMIDLERVNRVEVIDSKGRTYTNYGAGDVSISMQDGGKTLKIFAK